MKSTLLFCLLLCYRKTLICLQWHHTFAYRLDWFTLLISMSQIFTIEIVCFCCNGFEVNWFSAAFYKQLLWIVLIPASRSNLVVDLNRSAFLWKKKLDFLKLCLYDNDKHDTNLIVNDLYFEIELKCRKIDLFELINWNVINLKSKNNSNGSIK